MIIDMIIDSRALLPVHVIVAVIRNFVNETFNFVIFVIYGYNRYYGAYLLSLGWHKEGSTWVQIIYAVSHLTFCCFFCVPCHFL